MSPDSANFHTLGNTAILQIYKTAFLCSRKCPASVVLKAYDWAINQREAGRCVISGFYSTIQKDVLHSLLKGSQPIILSLARGFKERIEPEIKASLDNGRLLIVTPFEDIIKRVTSETAQVRNRLMIDLADEVVIAHESENGNLKKLREEKKGGKTVRYLLSISSPSSPPSQ